MRRQLDAVPARKAGHDRGDPALDCGNIGRAVNQPQLEFGDRRIALVLAIGGRTVGEVMLVARRDMRPGEDRRGRGRLARRSYVYLLANSSASMAAISARNWPATW